MKFLFLAAVFVAGVSADIQPLVLPAKLLVPAKPVVPLLKATPKLATPLPPKPIVPAPPKPLDSQHHGEEVVPILKSEMDVTAEGYSYAYETGNGISAQATGNLKTIGEEKGMVSQGSYQYISPEGVPVLVTWVADENGFQPQSDLLPTPPPVPEAILRLLEYLKTHPAKDIKNE